MPSPARPFRTRALAALAGAGIALAAAGTATAAEPFALLSPGAGATAPTGIARTPDGAFWITDHVLGLCKVQAGTPGSLVEGTPVCGEEAAITAGPVPAAGMAFDSQEKVFYLGGADLASAGVWRVKWDPGKPGDLDLTTMTQIVRLVTPGETVEGLSFDRSNPAQGGDPVLDFTTKRTNTVFRVVDPASCDDVNAPGPNDCSTLGTTRFDNVAEAALAGGGPLTHLGTKLFIGDGIGITTADVTGALPVTSQTATPLAGVPDVLVTALAADEDPSHDGGRLYYGTFGVAGGDAVWARPAAGAGESVLYASEHKGLSGLATLPDGDLLIGDDVAAVAGAEGAGRLFRMDFTNLAVPRVTLTQAPPAATNSTTATVTYSSRAGVAFQCRIDPPAGDLEGGWEACGNGPAAGRAYPGLAQGAHSIEVRAVDPGLSPSGVGPRTRTSFSVDTTAPTVRIDNAPADHSAPTGNLDLRFSSDEIGATFLCSLDSAPFTACESPLKLRGITGADHLVRVKAVDPAGNQSTEASWDFVVDPTKRPAFLAKLARVARGPVTARARISGRKLIVSIPAPAGSRAARIIIERKGVRRAGSLPTAPKALVATVVKLRPGRTNVVTWTPGPDRLGARINTKTIRVLVRVGPTVNRVGPGRAAILTSPKLFWVTGKAERAKGGAKR